MKRRYRNTLDFVLSGMRACRHNAGALLDGAETLLTQGQGPLALPVSVLALEEIGKLFVIDGLLFAKSHDHKAEAFKTGYRSHEYKLGCLDVFPDAMRSLALHNPRLRNDASLAQPAIEKYRQARLALSPWLGSQCDLMRLDRWKQVGFYVQAGADGFTTPAQSIDSEFASAVVALTATIVRPFGQQLDDAWTNYSTFARGMRGKMTESDHRSFQAVAAEAFEMLFPQGSSDAPPEGAA